MGDRLAPGRLRLVQDFVNTADLEGGEEELDSPAALGAWLAERSLVGHDVRLDPSDLERAKTVREALRSLLLVNGGSDPDPRAPETLNHEAAAARLVVEFEGASSSRLVPDASGMDRAVGELLGAVHTAMADGTWPRLKACLRHSCRWAFYDGSRNRSGAWCSMETCGNRTKAELYRQRHSH